MNWKKGFKRITHVVAIVIAVACGVIAVYLYNSWHAEVSFDRCMELARNGRAGLARQYGMSYDDYLQLEERDGSLPDGKSARGEVNQLFRENQGDMQNKSFWYRLSKVELIEMVVLYGLGSVVAGYVGTWAILWYGGLAIFVFIHWIVLGFREDKPANEQKE